MTRKARRKAHCGKCGSREIYLRFHGREDAAEGWSDVPCRKITGAFYPECERFKATGHPRHLRAKEHLRYLCQTCGFAWTGKVLPRVGSRKGKER